MQSHPDPEDGLEHIWAFIRMRFGYEQASMMQEHFETHVCEDGKDVAYQCLVRNCLGVMESLHMFRSIHTFPAKWLLKFAVEGNEGD